MGYKHNETDIIAVGSQLIRKKGYHRVGINEILKESGIPKGSFYNFFKSKEDFAQKMLSHYGTSGLEMIQSFLKNEALSPIDRLKSFYQYLIDTNVKEGLNCGCLVGNISMEVGGVNANIGQKADEEFLSWIEEISHCIAAAQEAGQIRKDVEALDLAEFMHAGLYGAFTRMKVQQSRRFLDRWYQMSFQYLEGE